ncbi:MAG: hypothetical protein A2583_07780 [Bdellovibrionales bacterium RIFOXYD1_FULL_53_11]|nr:MAG: hypothetical protein A2583_07780 [Bdellovibrionales bacterium RIFOXYD1_FULL_53_11]
MLFELALIAAAALAGLLGSMIGLGGGVFIVPLLTLLFGIDIRLAVGASIVSVIATSCGAAPGLLRAKLVNIRLAVVLETATVAGALAGVAVSGLVGTGTLYILFACVLFYSAGAMFFGKDKFQEQLEGSAATGRFDGHYHDKRLARSVGYRVRALSLGIALMWLAGVLSGLLGIGSGVLKVPAMDRVMGLPIRVSTATSNFMIGVTAAAGAGAYFARGDVQGPLAAPVALGVFAGAWAGSRLVPSLKASTIRIVFSVVIAAVAVQMFLRGVG